MVIKRLVLIVLLALAPIAALASSAKEHPVSPEQGLQMLTEGNLRFALGQTAHPNISFSRRLLTTTEGQAPFATVIGCSDSRLPLEEMDHGSRGPRQHPPAGGQHRAGRGEGQA